MSGEVTSVLFFAAGFGTRMRHLTANRPKPLVEVVGLPLIDHARALADAAGLPTQIANLHYKSEMLEDHLRNTNVQTITEKPEILETGGGLKNVRHLVDGDAVFTMNTDAVWRGPNPFEVLKSAWRPETMDGLLLLIPPAQTHAHEGVGSFAMDETGRLSWDPMLTYTGAQIIKHDGLSEISETSFSIKLLWEKMLHTRKLFGVVYDGKWCDVGHPDAIPVAEALIHDA